MRLLRGAFPIRLAIAGLLTAGTPLAVSARDPGDRIELKWSEGDVAGMTSIFSGDGKTMIGFVEYHQHREGDVLEAVRVAHFKDGSSSPPLPRALSRAAKLCRAEDPHRMTPATATPG